MKYMEVERLPDGASIFQFKGQYYCARGWHDPDLMLFATPEAARMAWEMSDKPEQTVGAMYAKHLGESMRASIDEAIYEVYKTESWKEMHTK